MQQTGLVQQAEGFFARAESEKLQQFVEDTRRRSFENFSVVAQNDGGDS